MTLTLTKITPFTFYSDANLRMRIVSHLRGEEVEEEEEDITEKT